MQRVVFLRKIPCHPPEQSHRMAAVSPLLPVVIAIFAGAAFDTMGGKPTFAALAANVGILGP